MGLQLNASNSLKQLAALLAEDLMKEGGDVFQKQYLVTQTNGMNNWLTIRLATHMGINANCSFLKPNDVIARLYYWMGGDNKQVLAPEQLQWLVYNLLDTGEFRDRFTQISGYYQHDEVKRIALAVKVADLFDQYQVYRPEMVEEWNNATVDNVDSTEWQKYLWIKGRETSLPVLTDKTTVIGFIIEQLKEPAQQERLQMLIPHLHIFGISVMTQLHIRLFNELSKYISVSFYLLNPAPSVYWLDDRTEKQIARMRRFRDRGPKSPEELQGIGNTLLVGWGKLVQETFSLLFEHEAFLNVYNDAMVEEPGSGGRFGLLQKIQHDIFYNHDEELRHPLSIADVKDGTLTINSCYTQVREVESLYNYLVHLVDQKKEQLSPRDIVVLVTDIDAYAPYIKAIFNTAPYKFPYSIADESLRSGDSLFTAIEVLLSIDASVFKAEEVMQLLDSSYIRTRFNITDTSMIRKAVSSANIRFGIEGKKDDDTVLVSWERGLQRILYGICMSGATEYVIGDETIFPLDVAEGENALQLTRFIHFFRVLKWYVRARSQKRTLAEWGEYIQQMVENLVLQPGLNEGDDDYLGLLKHIEHLNVLAGNYKEAISFDVFKHSFLEIIDRETRSGAFATGGITFCSLIPMRSIPFKIVGLLGMDFDKFPRKETPLSFNLMEGKRRKGDRNIKDNDRHLFLETLMSAQQYLYISYIGQNAKDNSVHPPSALLDELLDYVASGLKDTETATRKSLVTTQPLHGFSQQYFQQRHGLYSYLGDNAPKKPLAPLGKVPATGPLFNWDEIPIHSLLEFFRNPFKWYYNKVLAVNYRSDEVLLPDTEIFELDELQKWKLKCDLLMVEDDALEQYRLTALKTGRLPLKNMSAIAIADTLKAVEPARKLLKEYIGAATEEEQVIDIPLKDARITGKLNGIYDDKMVMVCFSKDQHKYLLEAYIRYLAGTAQGGKYEFGFLSAEHQTIYSIPKNTLTKARATDILGDLTGLFKRGHEKIFLFYPALAEKLLKSSNQDARECRALIEKLLEKRSDEYLQKEYENGIFDSTEAINELVSNTLALFTPVAQMFPAALATALTSKAKDQ